ncbi:MAG: alpha-galactosidase [Clostridia bacterium]|nr:alpha-galactosidase [Clostridia bacterium]
MIQYNESNMLFHLQGPTYSYLLGVKNDVLMQYYWGGRLPSDAVEGLLELRGEAASFDTAHSRHPLVVPTQEKGYFGQRALCVVNPEGDDVLSLRYQGYRILSGKKPLCGLPASYVENETEADTLEIDLKDELTGVAVTLSFTVFHAYDVLARSMQVKNEGDKPFKLTDVQSAMRLPADKYEIIHLKGAWARERQARRVALGEGTYAIKSRRGASGHENNPFMAIVKPHTTEDQGDVYAMTHVYSGSFSAGVDVGIDNEPTMMIGMCSDVFNWDMAPGAVFQSPEALFVYAPDGLNGLSHRMHPFVRQRICRGKWRDLPRPILVNNWEATYFGFNYDKLIAIAKRGAEIGCELFVLDDGWFGKRDSDNCSLGDWVVNEGKLDGGIKRIAESINELAMQFGLWFEPEMVSPDSDLYRAHPDWCLHVDGRDRTECRNQLILDMSRKEVQDYIIEIVSGVLRSAPISYVKWDMNRNMAEGFSCMLPAQQRMETQHRYMLGLYRVLEEITSAFPEVLFESCSGGGGRFDCGMLYYMPQTWTSDDTDARERTRIQYGTSLIYPCSAMGAHVSAVPNHQTGRIASFQTRCDVAMGGNFGFELDLSKQTEEDLATAKKAVEMVKKLRTVMQQGEYTRLLNPFENEGRAAWQFTRENTVIVCVYVDHQQPNPQPHRVKLAGLDPEAVYTDAENGISASGAALMNLGLIMPSYGGDFATKVYVFEKK